MADNDQQRPPLGGQQAATPAQGRTAKEIAQQRLALLKRGIMIASVASFGALAALAAQNHVGVTATGTATTQPKTQSAQPSTTTTTPDDGNGFFGQSNGNDNQGGYSFGQNGSQQQPVTGSSVS
jgi:hypothetical protein